MDPLEIGEYALAQSFASLDPRDLALAACVSRSWRQLAKRPSFWAQHWARTQCLNPTYLLLIYNCVL